MSTTIEPALTKTEWAAVAVAIQDAGRCGCAGEPAGRTGSFLRGLGRLLFGATSPTPFADPRLEAVRRFVCATHRRRAPSTELTQPLALHGFTPAQIDALGLLSR